MIPSGYTVLPMGANDFDIDGKAYVHWKSWQETYRGLVGDDYLDEKMTYERCRAVAHRSTDGVLVAKDGGGNVVGFACCGPYRDDTMEDTGEVYAIYVLAEHQKRGVGGALMDEALARLSAYSKVALWVLDTNERAIGFYERCGFRFDGVSTEIMLGIPCREVRMVLEL